MQCVHVTAESVILV